MNWHTRNEIYDWYSRHLRLQAGVHQGRMLTNMATALSGGGLKSVYNGYWGFMLKVRLFVLRCCCLRFGRKSCVE